MREASGPQSPYGHPSVLLSTIPALKPLFDRLFAGLQRPNTRVVVCMAPLLQGVSEALKEDRLAEILLRYQMANIFVLCVDRDGVMTRRNRLDELERKLGTPRCFPSVNAWEELETSLPAGLDLRKEWVGQISAGKFRSRNAISNRSRGSEASPMAREAAAGHSERRPLGALHRDTSEVPREFRRSRHPTGGGRRGNLTPEAPRGAARIVREPLNRYGCRITKGSDHDRPQHRS
jgi:hypothetical protein